MGKRLFAFANFQFITLLKLHINVFAYSPWLRSVVAISWRRLRLASFYASLNSDLSLNHCYLRVSVVFNVFL